MKKRATRIATLLAAPPTPIARRADRFAPKAITTPIPPSAGKITSDLPQRWAAYSLNEPGHYFYKREQAPSLKELQEIIRNLNLHTTPIWTYVRSGRTDEELIMPIRIPEEATASLGHRWHQLKQKGKK